MNINMQYSVMLLHTSLFEPPPPPPPPPPQLSHLTLTVPCSHTTGGELKECMRIFNEFNSKIASASYKLGAL